MECFSLESQMSCKKVLVISFLHNDSYLSSVSTRQSIIEHPTNLQVSTYQHRTSFLQSV